MKKITLFIAALFITMSAFATTLYFVPNNNWKADNARFAAYFFEGGETWVSLTDSNSDGIYEVEVPANHKKVIFCRMNPGTQDNKWDNKWNQTADLNIPTDDKVKFVVPDGVWDGASNDYWTTMESEGVEVPNVWTIAGSSTALFGTAWDVANTNNDLTEGENGVWTKVYTNVTLSAGEIEYKIAKGHAWGESYPGDNAKLNIPANGNYDVTFTFNINDKTVNAVAEEHKETPVALENTTINNIFAQNGMIVAEEEIAIFTIAGQNVTALNGNLEKGVYIVKSANATAKVIVK